jgi:S1-C subfamily serine protease
MVDGQRLELPKGAAETSLGLSRDVMRDLGASSQVGVRACAERWSLDDKQLHELHGFVARYEEELAWKDPPRHGGAGGKHPPAGGWPAWQPLASSSVAVAGAPLAGTELFQKLSPSVLRVEGKLASGYSLGSAVAVTPTLLITNCHVIEGALKVSVKQAKQTWPAKVKHSDPLKDRCVLEVPDAVFTPIAGVRPFMDLKVGEQLYTLGNPNGLDLTLADGILSALREEDGVRYVQTTAPISPGSSGGGLFDARGNLVGVTTLVVVGKEHLNQSLNFAIAAESYWTP